MERLGIVCDIFVLLFLPSLQELVELLQKFLPHVVEFVLFDLYA